MPKFPPFADFGAKPAGSVRQNRRKRGETGQFPHDRPPATRQSRPGFGGGHRHDIASHNALKRRFRPIPAARRSRSAGGGWPGNVKARSRRCGAILRRGGGCCHDISRRDVQTASGCETTPATANSPSRRATAGIPAAPSWTGPERHDPGRKARPAPEARPDPEARPAPSSASCASIPCCPVAPGPSARS